MAGFKLEAFLNPNMALGAGMVTVAFTAGGEASVTPVSSIRRIVGLVIDCSGSMEDRSSSSSTTQKMDEAKHAARVFVDTLTQDTEFFIISFANNARVIQERGPATESAKRSAHKAIQTMFANGGTFMSSALAAVRNQLVGCEGAICVVGLLTDGDNAVEDSAALEKEIKACDGKFQAHCRGIGTNWKRAILQPVSDALMGTISLITGSTSLVEDFRGILQSAMSKSVLDLRLRLWTPKVVTIKSLKQMFPTEIDITSKMVAVDQRTVEFPLGAWGQDSQDYQAVFEVPARAPDGLSTAICRAFLVYTAPSTGQPVEVICEVNYDPRPGWSDIRAGVVEAAWTDDASLTMRVNSVVAHYSGEGEKTAAKQEFAEAWERGDTATATVRLQRVMKLAEDSGDEATKRMVRQVADVDQTGTITLRRRGQDDKAAVMQMEVASTRTVRARR